jgi:hypothetical protein
MMSAGGRGGLVEIDPAEALRPARAADWTSALLRAAADAPAADGTRALGLAAALASALGEGDRAVACLRLLRRRDALGQLVAAALGQGDPSAQQVAPLLRHDRDWVVLQCYRAGLEVPAALAIGVNRNALAAMDLLPAVEELAHAALACQDPGAVATGLGDWLSRADSEGIDHFIGLDALALVCRTIVRLGLRGAAQNIRPEQFGLLIGGIDSEFTSEAYGEFRLLAIRLMGLGYSSLVVSLAEESTGGGRYFDDIAVEALLLHGKDDEAVAQLAKLLADRALQITPGISDWGAKMLPSQALPPSVVSRLLDVAREAPPSLVRTYLVDQLERDIRSASVRLEPPDASAAAAEAMRVVTQEKWSWFQALQILARQGHWSAAVSVATAGEETFWRVKRLGYLARLGAEHDAPDALPTVLAAVGSLPLSPDEISTARGMVVRECVFAERWNW